jgi:hypothetical protein|tara:strand:+ start:1796 stop:1936 length:141 start_codon:yes stop_codon:yes gene_type:complete
MVCFINSISLVEKGSNFDEKYHDAVERQISQALKKLLMTGTQQTRE